MVAIRGLANFVKNFFDQNPLSLIGIIAAHNKKAEMVTDLSGTSYLLPNHHFHHQSRYIHLDHNVGNPLHQIRLLEDEADRTTGGDFSLQNCLELARASLRFV